MEICRICEYGVFDTRHAFPGWKRSSGRVVQRYELEFFTSDTGKTTVDGKSYDITSGSFLCARPGQVRASVFDFRCCYLHLELDEASPYRALLDSIPNFYQIIDCDAYGRLFEELLHHLIGEGERRDSDYVNAKLLELFFYLRKDAQRNRNYLEHAARHKSSDAHLPEAIEFMKTHYAQPLTLADIAGVTGYSPNYFHHVFSSVMGRTPQQYLLNIRIRHAKYLLAQSEKTLSEIAYECGFSSQAYFTEQFKKMTYATPRQYRRRFLEQYLP
ncbi:MAG: helix-turn-helix transcriptional regulator [Clostridia bacterium]|nr:helix-turn-helix transcriptional regulator [Clostridia bacterium]